MAPGLEDLWHLSALFYKKPSGLGFDIRHPTPFLVCGLLIFSREGLSLPDGVRGCHSPILVTYDRVDPSQKMPMSNSRTYPSHYYDDHLVLRVPPVLWIAMAFLVRDVALLAVTFIPRSGDAIIVLRDFVQPLFLAADLPALLVLAIALRRKPDSPDWMRRIWGWGRQLLALSAVLHLGLWAARFGMVHHWNPYQINEGVILSLALDAVILVYLLTSPLLRDLFRDFPTAG